MIRARRWRLALDPLRFSEKGAEAVAGLLATTVRGRLAAARAP